MVANDPEDLKGTLKNIGGSWELERAAICHKARTAGGTGRSARGTMTPFRSAEILPERALKTTRTTRYFSVR